MIVLGYDPGGGGKSGKRKSGVAILDASRSTITTGQCGSVHEALSWFERERSDREPTAIGIDTFLHWATGPKGWRPADYALRRNYRRVRNSIQPSNSTAGSMAVQGMALAIAAKNKWPNIRLNEVHHKVLFAEFSDVQYPREADAVDIRTEFLSRNGFSCKGDMTFEDEFDAAICCIATAKGLMGDWCNLMAKSLGNAERSELIFPVGHVDYFWPKPLS